MLRIGPVIWIHTSRTGASSFSAAFREYDSTTRCAACVRAADFRGSSRVLPVLSRGRRDEDRSEEHTSELQSLMRISYAVFCLKKHRRRTDKFELQMNNT